MCFPERVKLGPGFFANVNRVLSHSAPSTEIENVWYAGYLAGVDLRHTAATFCYSVDLSEVNFLTLGFRRLAMARALRFMIRANLGSELSG